MSEWPRSARRSRTATPTTTEKLQERLAKLAVVSLMIKAGAPPRSTQGRKHRIEDAVHNPTAVEEGIVAGKGVTLLQAAPTLDELERRQATGANIVKVALEAPLARSPWRAGAGRGGRERCATCVATDLNAQTEVSADLLAAGVADPVKVTRSALQNAASIAELF